MNTLTPKHSDDEAVAARAVDKARNELLAKIFTYLVSGDRAAEIRQLIYHDPEFRALGWPDFTFFYRGEILCLAARLPGVEATLQELLCHGEIQAAGRLVFVARSADDVTEMLAAVDYAVETGR